MRSRVHLILFVGILVCCPPPIAAQTDESYKGFFLGIGMGQDVGGIIGARATYWATPFLSAFAGGGWAIVDGAWNLGVELRVPSKTRAQPFATGMYGYNGVIHIKGLEKLDKVYYGPTIGGGAILKQRHTDNYWRFSMNFPLERQEMYEEWEAIKKRPDVTMIAPPLPFTFGIGFHFNLRN